MPSRKPRGTCTWYVPSAGNDRWDPVDSGIALQVPLGERDVLAELHFKSRSASEKYYQPEALARETAIFEAHTWCLAALRANVRRTKSCAARALRRSRYRIKFERYLIVELHLQRRIFHAQVATKRCFISAART